MIARLGADPPRQLLESFGIAFPNDDPDALPQLGADAESSVAGLYIVGALAGYPLIKQAMNQGQDVVDRILGKPVEPVDEPLLKARLAKFRQGCTVLKFSVPWACPRGCPRLSCETCCWLVVKLQ